MFTSRFSVFHRISLDLLDRISQPFHHMKALCVPMMDLYLIFQFCRNEGKQILRAFFARSPDVRTVSFCYYLLGGDTAAPSGLYAKLCHAFLVLFCFCAMNFRAVCRTCIHFSRVCFSSVTNMPMFELQSCVGNNQTITNTNVVANNSTICENTGRYYVWAHSMGP